MNVPTLAGEDVKVPSGMAKAFPEVLLTPNVMLEEVVVVMVPFVLAMGILPPLKPSVLEPTANTPAVKVSVPLMVTPWLPNVSDCVRFIVRLLKTAGLEEKILFGITNAAPPVNPVSPKTIELEEVVFKIPVPAFPLIDDVLEIGVSDSLKVSVLLPTAKVPEYKYKVPLIVVAPTKSSCPDGICTPKCK